jgi:hypothetical protein
LTALFRALPAENFGTVAAAICTFSPVRGFTPCRAARSDEERVNRLRGVAIREPAPLGHLVDEILLGHCLSSWSMSISD